MKRIEKGVEPSGLALFRAGQPDATWDEFKLYDKGNCYRALVQYLYMKQQGLCAYCEINLVLDQHGRRDYSVDHFHPKSKASDERNWALDYENLFLSCRGGSDTIWANQEDQGRYLKPVKENLSCDAKKGNQILDNKILNPFEMPDQIRLFEMNLHGEVKPHPENCVRAGVDEKKIQATITELGLDCERLRRARKAMWDSLFDFMLADKSFGEDAILKWILPDSRQCLTPFHSTLRAFFGKKGDDLIASHGMFPIASSCQAGIPPP
ncbi:MAG: TIGR02646 family protein [Magnetococcales bacterium]|nr:TIGR02646 family protein [Magnetococcales bacterium]